MLWRFWPKLGESIMQKKSSKEINVEFEHMNSSPFVVVWWSISRSASKPNAFHMASTEHTEPEDDGRSTRWESCLLPPWHRVLYYKWEKRHHEHKWRRNCLLDFVMASSLLWSPLRRFPSVIVAQQASKVRRAVYHRAVKNSKNAGANYSATLKLLQGLISTRTRQDICTGSARPKGTLLGPSAPRHFAARWAIENSK